ncbi:MAG: sugar phosphate nucleotidyltransferase, partial [Gaiellaceae bacterium]
MKAVVMAGGEGTRLRPLTSNQPKPLVPIVGKPCMEHILELLRRHGFEDVIVTVAFLPQAIRGYFGTGESLGMNLSYSVEESPAGTAGSVRLAAGRLDDTFLVISGDALCDVDLGRLVAYHREKEASVTIGLKSVDNPLEFGIVVTDDDGRVERFLEKPSWGQVFSDTINTGIYVLEPEVLKHIPSDRPFDFSKELFPLLLEMGRPMFGCVLEGYWQDIGNLDQYRQANFDALDEKVRLEVSGIRLRGNVWLGEGVDVHDLDAIEGPAYLGNYCRVAPEATVGPYSVLSTSVTLRERARTTRSIVDASTYIGRSALVEGAIVGRSCDLRAHVRVHEGVAIGDEVTVGAESVIMPGVRIYPYKEVETGAHLFESLIWESRGTARIFGKDGVSGLVNVDLTPDVAVRLAAALGTALKRGARVVASREGTPACRMMKRAMISGLSSTGVDVADLRVIPAAVARHLVKSEGFDAGFHVGVSPNDSEAVRIQFFEPPGIEMGAATQKEVEKHFTRGEIRRVASGDVGRITYPARA